MWGSFAQSLTSTVKGFVADVQFTVNAVLEDEKKEYAAEQERLAKLKLEQEEAEKKRERQAVPIWTIWNEDKRSLEPDLQQKILKLATDRRTFLAPAPDASAFSFSMDTAGPFATYALELDLALERARYLLVPRKLSEEQFWRNYFYRVENIRGIMKVDSIFSIPEKEALRRQHAMAIARAAAPSTAQPANRTTAASSTAAGRNSSVSVDDDDDFNHEELNQYLNEELSDDENDEPSTVDGVSAPSASSLTLSAAAAATPSSSTTTAAVESFSTLNVASPPIVTSTPTQPQTQSSTRLSVSAISFVSSAAASASTTTVSLAAASLSKPLPVVVAAAVVAPVSAPSKQSTIPCTTTIVSSASLVVTRSPLDENDEEDLAELESMLEEVETAGVTAVVTDEEAELDKLAELEKELDI